MKKKLIGKKAVALVMAAGLLMGSISGCGKAAEGNGAAGANSDEVNEAFKFASVSDVQFPLKEKLNLNVFVYATTTGGGTYQDNYVTDWIEEKTNIHLNFVYDVYGDDAKTKLNLIKNH